MVCGFLTDSQHHFRAKHSCEPQLLTLVERILQGLVKGWQFELAIIDFTKAFDVVLHKVSLWKLIYYDIKVPCLDWVEDFLKNRS